MKGIYGLMILVLSSCATAKNTTDSNLSGNWELVMFPSAGKSFTELYGDRKPELQFTANDNSVSGTTGCNRLRTTYLVKGNHFTVNKNIITTKMACEGYDETAFLNALSKVNRYIIKNGQLRLMEDSVLVMAFAKK